MRTFTCLCGARLFFDNQTCLACSRQLGFLPDRLTLTAIEAGENGDFETGAGRYRKCGNYVEHGVCNWMVPAGDPQPLCLACRLNHVIPDLADADSRARWATVEAAKRQLVYSLLRLGLPLLPKSEDAERGLAFDIKADSDAERVLTGHADGLITLNLAEADPLARERMRLAMNERYRTMLGHFRHEVGHYYWDRLVRDGDQLDAFRTRFGDERQDYDEALRRHYGDDAGPPAAGGDTHISAYAAAHPWEDWAETFAHYLHIVDTLETAHHFGFTTTPAAHAKPPASGARQDIDLLLDEWMELTVALNALNRSMGLADAYPFVISPAVRAKLALVHELVRGTAGGATSAVPAGGAERSPVSATA